MDYFTKRNAVILGLVQTGLVVIGVLAAGAAYKWHATFLSFNSPRGTPLFATAFACDYGFLALVVPLAWTTLAMVVVGNKDDEVGPRWLVFLFGFLIVVALLIGIYQSSVYPLLRLTCGCGGLSA